MRTGRSMTRRCSSWFRRWRCTRWHWWRCSDDGPPPRRRVNADVAITERSDTFMIGEAPRVRRLLVRLHRRRRLARRAGRCCSRWRSPMRLSRITDAPGVVDRRRGRRDSVAPQRLPGDTRSALSRLAALILFGIHPGRVTLQRLLARVEGLEGGRARSVRRTRRGRQPWRTSSSASPARLRSPRARRR